MCTNCQLLLCRINFQCEETFAALSSSKKRLTRIQAHHSKRRINRSLLLCSIQRNRYINNDRLAIGPGAVFLIGRNGQLRCCLIDGIAVGQAFASLRRQHIVGCILSRQRNSRCAVSSGFRFHTAAYNNRYLIFIYQICYVRCHLTGNSRVGRCSAVYPLQFYRQRIHSQCSRLPADFIIIAGQSCRRNRIRRFTFHRIILCIIGYITQIGQGFVKDSRCRFVICSHKSAPGHTIVSQRITISQNNRFCNNCQFLFQKLQLHRLRFIVYIAFFLRITSHIFHTQRAASHRQEFLRRVNGQHSLSVRYRHCIQLFLSVPQLNPAFLTGNKPLCLSASCRGDANRNGNLRGIAICPHSGARISKNSSIGRNGQL